jgi:ribosomal protein S18 acetylase RimI-like enzyme
VTAALGLRPAAAADAEAIAAVHIQSWRETYAGLLPTEVLAALDPMQRAAMWRSVIGGKGKVWLAELGGIAVGFGACGRQRDASFAVPCRFPGEIGALYVLRRAQRQGIGRSLMAAMAGDLLAAGLTGASLWVMDANAPAHRFYTALGGSKVAGRQEILHGLPVAATAYGWSDLSVLR